MRNLLLLLGATAALSAAAADSHKLITGELDIIPDFTMINGEGMLTALSDSHITVYDNSLNTVETINIPEGQVVTLQQWHQNREYTYSAPTLISTESTGYILNIDGQETGITAEAALEHILRWNGGPASISVVNDEIIIILYYFEENYYGQKYISNYYKLVQGRWVEFHNEYQLGEWGAYGDWEEKSYDTYTQHISGLTDICFFQNCVDYNYTYLTQNLFNTDSQFEYVVAKTKKVEFTEEGENYRNGGETIIPTGFSVMSQNGTKLYDIDIPEEYQGGNSFSSIDLYILGSKKYIVIDGYSKDSSDDISLFYELDPTGGIKAPQVIKSKMRVSPATPRHGETVSIDLGEAAASATSVNVVSANGATVRTLPVSAGRQSVSLSTAGLASGLYIVTANGREAAKIIIR